jgi:acyl carrier protein
MDLVEVLDRDLQTQLHPREFFDRDSIVSLAEYCLECLKQPPTDGGADEGAIAIFAAPEAVSVGERRLRHVLLETPEHLRRDLLESHLRRQIAAVLHLSEAPSATMAPTQLGMDSIMIMDLVEMLDRDLEAELHPREFFDRDSIASLAEYCLESLQKPPVQRA